MLNRQSILRVLVLLAAITGPAIGGPAAAQNEGLLIFAAASLKNAMDDVAHAYEATHPDDLRISYAGSSTLARQIERGAPADIYVSANQAWMDRLADDGRLRAGSRFDLLHNTLVLVAPKHRPGDNSEPLDSLSERSVTQALGTDGYLAMANTNAVPAGIYGRQALQHLGLWESLQGRIVQAMDVRAALALVARGETPLGIVYASDAVAEHSVRVVYRFTACSHDSIVYPAAILDNVDNPQAERFIRFLRGDTAGRRFEKWGFERTAEQG